jgi:homoserine dehydrogenase
LHRYAAEVTESSINVGLMECGPDNALAALTGTDNLVSISSEWYQSPLVISGPGAGLEVTAAGVLSDAVELGAGKLMNSKWGR